MSGRNLGAVVAGAALLLVLGIGLAALLTRDDNEPQRLGAVYAANVTTVTTTYDADTQYVGKCGIVTPPDPDACDAVQGTLRYSFWGSMVNSIQFNKWKQKSPKDYQRLLGLMASPQCSVPSNPQPQIMVTPLGAALANVVQAYNCAHGIEPIALPAANPPLDPNRADKQPPTAPGPLQVTP
jgi:hypothetical protein